MYVFSELIIYICNYWISFFPSRRLRRLWYVLVMKYSIDPDASIFLGCVFDCRRGFSIGPNSVINEKCRLDSRGGIIIGANVSISSEVVILTATHDPRSSSFQGVTAPVLVMDYSWIGTRAIILPGVTIGRGAVIGAGSVVAKSVGAGETVVGVPAKVISNGRTEFDYILNYKRLFH